MPPIRPPNVISPLSQIPALPLQRGGPRLQPSAANPPPQNPALIFQQDMINLQPSSVCAAAAPTTPSLSVSLQGRVGPPHPHSAVHTDAPLLSALLPQKAEPPLQPSAVNPPHLPQILALPLQLDVPPLQTTAVHAPHPPIYVLIQGQGKPTLLSPTVHV